MQGLLEFLQTPAGQGLLSAGLGVAANAGRGGTWNAIGRGGLMGLQGYAAANEQERMRPIRDMEMQANLLNLNKAKRDASTEQAVDDAARNSYVTPEMAFEKNGVSMGPQMDGSALPHVNPGFDTKGYTDRLFGIDPLRAVAFQQSQTKSNAPIKLGAGESLIDPVTLQPRYTAPTTQKLPSSVEEYNYAKGQGYGGTYEQWQMQQKKAGATTVSVNTGQKGLENELKIRGEFKSEPIYKAHQEVESAYRQISSSLKMASPAGDLAGATKIMKILDPGSVVRESELGMAMKASGALDRLQNYADNIIKGTKLTPDQRKDFQALADQLYGESVKQYNTKRGEYAGFAGDYQLNPDRILGAAITSPKLPTTPAGKPAPGAGARFLGFE